MTAAREGGASPAGGEREPWIDLVKAVAIVLVVLRHAEGRLAAHGLADSWWAGVTTALATLRMPTFFLVSGLFARRSLTLPSSVFRTRKVWRFLWIYLVWSVGYVVMLVSIGMAGRDGTFSGEAREWITESLTASSELWYVVALPVFFLGARALRRVPVAAQIIGASALSFIFSAGLVQTGLWGPDHMADYFVFFLTGCYFSRVIRSVTVRIGWWPTAIVGIAWVGLCVTLDATRWENIGDAFLPLLAVPFTLTLAARLARHDWTGPVAWLGRNTLPVYVMHFAPVGLIVFAVRREHLINPGSPLAAASPILVTVLSVGAVLAVRPLVVRWAPWSLALPAVGTARTGPGRRDEVSAPPRPSRPAPAGLGRSTTRPGRVRAGSSIRPASPPIRR